jgi:hypothetical protein
MATVLSGISGAFYYKPAGTVDGFIETAINTSTDTITIASALNFKAGDPVKFRIYNPNTGATVTPDASNIMPALSAGSLSTSTTYYVLTYNASTGAMTVSASQGGVSLNFSDDGTLASPNKFQVYYADYAAVAEVRDWSLEVSRTEIDVTTIGKQPGQFVPFRTFIAGFGEATGSATVYMTDEDAASANRMIQDVLLRKQVGASMRLYVDQVFTGGVLDNTASRSIYMEVALTSASLAVNPDDGQQISINFRPLDQPTFDLTTTA